MQEKRNHLKYKSRDFFNDIFCVFNNDISFVFLILTFCFDLSLFTCVHTFIHVCMFYYRMTSCLWSWRVVCWSTSTTWALAWHALPA